MMAGIGAYVLGGAMQGLGQGMMQKQEAEDEERKYALVATLQERRDRALEILRHQHTTDRDRQQNEYAALDDQRDFDLQSKRDERAFQREVKLGQAGAQAKSEERLQQRQWDLEDREDEQRFKLTEIGARSQATIKEYNATNSDEIVRVVTDGPTGAVFGITKHGDSINLSNKGAIARPKPASRSSLLFDDDLVQPNLVKPVQIGRDANGKLTWPEPPPGFEVQE